MRPRAPGSGAPRPLTGLGVPGDPLFDDATRNLRSETPVKEKQKLLTATFHHISRESEKKRKQKRTDKRKKDKTKTRESRTDKRQGRQKEKHSVRLFRSRMNYTPKVAQLNSISSTCFLCVYLRIK